VKIEPSWNLTPLRSVNSHVVSSTARHDSARPGLIRPAVRAVEAVGGYLFGAVDIGRLVGGGFVVLEVNTRPGIEGSTVIQYAKAVIEYAKNH